METSENCQFHGQGQKQEEDDAIKNKNEIDLSSKKTNIRKDSVILAKRRMAKANKRSVDDSDVLFPGVNHSPELRITKIPQTNQLSEEQQLPPGQSNGTNDINSQNQPRHVIVLEDEVQVIPSDDNIIDVGDKGDINNEREISYSEELKF